MNIKILSAGLALLLAGNAYAVKAKPGVTEFQQPDGSVINIILHGDENFHYATDTEGRLVKLDNQGKYRYAEAGVSIGSLMAEASFSKRKGNPKYRYSNSAFPTTGEPHSLVILVEYPDYGFSKDDPIGYFREFLNGENFTKDENYGSCRQFFIENSKGIFAPTFDVYGPVVMKNKRAYYGGGQEVNACQMVVEAVKALDAQIDFSQYDHNGDGYVDSVYIIYADKGEANGGPAESVWPYSWELEDEGVYLSADNVKFNTYGVSNEIKPNGKMEGIGTFTHEFGHVLGLPDLYNTENGYDNSTPCDWSVMDSGSYNNDSRTPCNLSAFERYSLGWLDPEEIFYENNSLTNLADSNHAYMITSEQNPDEFFILENRQQEGWDKYLPGHGMLIWHVEFIQRYWDENIVNNFPKKHQVDLVRADNNTNQTSLHSDSFPGEKNITEFSTETEPALLTWEGTHLNVTAIKNIAEEDGKIHFNAVYSEFRGDAGVDTADIDSGIRIIDRTVYSNGEPCIIFDISGRAVGTATRDRGVNLSKGTYIIAGKKYIL